MGLGELAGMMSIAAALNKVTNSAGVIKVPHMLYEQLQWVKKSPPGHPMLTLSVTVSTKGYKDNGYKPPPATRRRNTDMSCLADTGCQACCMGPTQLYKLGMTEKDLLEPILSLRAANKTGIIIVGAVYLESPVNYGKLTSFVMLPKGSTHFCYLGRHVNNSV